MGDRERGPQSNDQQEILDPHHFYASYVFDKADEHETDIGIILQQAGGLGYPVRYWWLSDAMDLQGTPDRLILCVHHPSRSEDAGMDLYESLSQKAVTWDDLEAAAVNEYRFLGKPVKVLEDMRSPFGNNLFLQKRSEKEPLENKVALFIITPEDVRGEVESRLGRELTEMEFSVVLAKFKKSLDWLDWAFYLDETTRQCQETGQLGPHAEDYVESF